MLEFSVGSAEIYDLSRLCWLCHLDACYKNFKKVVMSILHQFSAEVVASMSELCFGKREAARGPSSRRGHARWLCETVGKLWARETTNWDPSRAGKIRTACLAESTPSPSRISRQQAWRDGGRPNWLTANARVAKYKLPACQDSHLDWTRTEPMCCTICRGSANMAGHVQLTTGKDPGNIPEMLSKQILAFQSGVQLKVPKLWKISKFDVQSTFRLRFPNTVGTSLSSDVSGQWTIQSWSWESPVTVYSLVHTELKSEKVKICSCNFNYFREYWKL